MDFKSKLWAGNIYHQLEYVFCTDMDELVNKDTLKFVGNQVQSVGMSVKRLYSDVVKDILSLSGDAAKPEQKLAAREQVDMQDRVSIAGTRATSTCADEMQLAKNQVSDDHKVRISQLVDVPEAQTCRHMKEQGNAMVPDSEDSISAEKNIIKDLKPVTANSSFDGDIFSAKSDEDVSSSLAFSAHEEERKDLNQQKGDEVLSDDTMPLFDSPSTAWLFKSKSVEGPYSDVNGSLSSPPVPVFTQDNCSLMDSPLPPACDVDDKAREKYPALSKSCSTEDDSVDLSTSVQSSEHVFSSMTAQSSYTDFSKAAADVLQSRSSNVSDGCTYDISAASSTKSLMMESNDYNTLNIDRSEFLDGSFESGHEEHYKNGHSETLISLSETESTYGLGGPIGDLDLDNVDLSSNAKHDGRSVILYSNFAEAGSYRRRNFRYYKKLIHGAFTSRKRLTKEYEQLAIMYGDIDVESNQHYKPSSLSSFPDTAQHAEGTQSSQEMNENEWELL